MPPTLAELLAVAAACAFRATGRDRSGPTVGVLAEASQRHLAVTSNGAWTLSAARSPGPGPVLLHESAANGAARRRARRIGGGRLLVLSRDRSAPSEAVVDPREAFGVLLHGSSFSLDVN